LTGLLDVADAEAYTVPFNRLRGQMTVTPDEVRLANAELRFFPAGSEKTGGAGIVTGTVGYRFREGTLTTDLVGASLPLANFRRVRANNLPFSGQISFRLKSTGPLLRPQADGSFRVVDLQMGNEVIGSFESDLHADGETMRLKVTSAMSTGAIGGDITLGLTDPNPLNGKVSIKNINLDPYLVTALHLGKFNGHGTADGDISVTGELQHPETLTVDANFSHFIVTYGSVQLENTGPIHITSTRDKRVFVRLDPIYGQADTFAEAKRLGRPRFARGIHSRHGRSGSRGYQRFVRGNVGPPAHYRPSEVEPRFGAVRGFPHRLEQHERGLGL